MDHLGLWKEMCQAFNVCDRLHCFYSAVVQHSYKPLTWIEQHRLYQNSCKWQIYIAKVAERRFNVLNQILFVFCRPVCGVAGIQSSQNHVQHPAAAPVALPHCSHSGGTGSSLAYRNQMDSSSPMLMSSSPQTPQTQEQNGILDWLRKLRLHKYYPVFKQLTMEKVGLCVG